MRVCSLIIWFIVSIFITYPTYADTVYPAERDFQRGKEGVAFYFNLSKHGKIHVNYSCLDSKIWHNLCRENDNSYPYGILIFARDGDSPSVIVQHPTDFYGSTRKTIQLSFRNTYKEISEPDPKYGTFTIGGSLVDRSEYQKKPVQIGSNYYAIIGWRDDAHCILAKYYPVEVEKYGIYLYNAAIYKVKAKRTEKQEIVIDDFIHGKRESKELTRILRTSPKFSIHYLSPTTK